MTDNATASSSESPRALNTTDDAAKAFLGILSGKPARQAPKEAPASEPADDFEVEASGETPSDSRAREDDLDEAEAAEGPDEEATDVPDEGAEEAPEEETRVYTVKVAGQEIQVSEKELLDGYSRTADYHRKTEALANERKAFEQHAQAVIAERQQYSQMLGALQQQLQAPLPAPPTPPDPSLRQTDPLEYALQRSDYDDRMQLWQQTVSAVQAEQARIAQMQQATEFEQLRDHLRQGFQKLPELVPAWKDPKVFERDTRALRDYGKKLGYSDDELNQAYDPRAVAALYKAMKYDELQARRPKPNVPLERVLRPSGPAQRELPNRVDQQARQRLRQSGRVEDAAAVMARMLKD